MDDAFRKIIKLDETVINRIAAGEVVQRPANAIKELIENCIDAKSTNIQITIKDGGLKLLQIQDNGTGIRKEDLEIVCERFTTSKLTNFDDLKTIATYGFRGEALSSISHVSHVTIRTRTADANCAVQVSYDDGKPKGPPKPCAGNLGTIITVEDLFYNVPVRRKVIASPAAEFARIADVVGRYAVHNSGIGFSLKKHGDNASTIKTMPYSTTADNIKLIYGADVSKELLDISAESQPLKFKLNGFVTKFDYGGKKTILLLFINNRLVECSPIRKAIESVYTAYLNKNTFPFIYLSLQIAPQNVDVNVHPTKEEVMLLHQADIQEEIQKVIETRLMTTSQCRKFYTQTLLPLNRSGSSDGQDAGKGKSGDQSISESPSSQVERVYQHKMVRTDHRERKLDAFFLQPSTNLPGKSATVESPRAPKETSPAAGSASSGFVRQGLELDSVLNLFAKIKQQCSAAHRSIFQNLTFVGCVSREMSLIQHETNLYLLNVKKLSERLFYQIMIRDFGKFGILKLSNPAPIYDLVLLAMETSDCGYDGECGSRENLARYVVDKLKSNSELLKDYFSMEIDEDGNLLSLPYLLDKYTPDMSGLPVYILRLSTEVDWDHEQECFETFCQETSRFYAFSTTDYDAESASTVESASDIFNPSESLPTNVAAEQKWKWTVEHIIFPAFRSTFQPSKDDSENGSILKVANLDELYHVFERC